MLQDAQAFVYQTLRCREMRSALTALPIALNATTAALPTGFLDPIVVLNQYMRPLKLRDQKSLFSRMGVNASVPPGFIASVPTSFCIAGEQYNFDCAANAALGYWQVYYQQPAYLSPDNKTNFLTNRYPHVLRSACLAIAADFEGDDESYQRYSTRLQALIADLVVKDDLANRGIWVDGDYTDA